MVDVEPGVAEDSPASKGQHTIPMAIVAELIPRSMRRPAVELDDDLLVVPYGIRFDRDLFQRDRCVEFRRWQVFIQDQGSEAVL